MSSAELNLDGPGGGAVAEEALRQSKALVETAQAEEEQLDLLAPPTPEEMAEAREELGPDAGRLTVLRHARARRGRPKGSRNKRTDDFARYLQSFGQDPAITMAQIAATPPEMLVEASIREHTKVTEKGQLITWKAPTLTYEGAQSLRLRAAEGLMPFAHSKKPVAVDMTLRGDFELIEEITDPRQAANVEEGEFVEIQPEADAA